jgi:hypothetical protein
MSLPPSGGPSGPRSNPHASSAEPPCSVPGCGAESVRSLAVAEARKAFASIPDGRRAHLCREHYRGWKKATKKDRELQRLGR